MKKICSILLPILISLSLSVTSFAANDDNSNYVFSEVDGDMTIAEGADEFVPSAMPQRDVLTKTVGLDSAQGVKYNLKVSHFKQENSHYCGPATVQQTLHYLTGTKYTQKALAKELSTTNAGTDMTKIADVINKHSSSKKYTMYEIPSTQGEYVSQIGTALANGKPVIIDIYAKSGNGWNYTTNGHFLNITGLVSNTSQNTITVTDPNSNSNTNVYSASVVYKVNSNHFRHAYIK